MSQCPTCRQQIKPPKPKTEREPARPKVRIRIDVPVDERENGFEVFHHLLRECALELGRGENTPAYFSLVEVMHFFLTTPKDNG